MQKTPTFPFIYSTPHNKKLFFIAGPCVIESENLCLNIAESLAQLSDTYSVDIIFKASYDKANRTSKTSFRGPGRTKGLKILDKVKRESGLKIITDIHTPGDASEAADVADILQIPALLCRQTDLLVSARKTGKYVNVKKGQFMAPEDMRYALEKTGNKTWLTERGTFFGYNRLVVDFAGITTLKSFGVPVIFDATHSVQIPGGGNGCSSGNRNLAFPLARAAVSVGVDGLFFEVHPDPDKALCDGPNSIYLSDFEKNLCNFIDLFNITKNH